MTHSMTVPEWDQYLAAQELKDATRRRELDELVDALVAHKWTGCSQPACPGPKVSEFFSNRPSTGRYLLVALHMLAEVKQT